MAIGDWVLRESCKQAATWPSDVKVAVNLSAAQFKCATLTQSIVAALAASGLSPGRLELEITESAVLADPILPPDFAALTSQAGPEVENHSSA
jgi:EAL domain-containing protein (putative c-di-GMP-specific phosphodiesterase class I)